MDRKKFVGITSDAFVAPTDKAALEALKKVPLLPKVIRKFHEMGVDRWLYCWNMSQSVRCGPKQFGTLDRIMQECCAVLDMPEPELYVTSHPMPNAFAGGIERPYIVLRNSIVNSMTDEQLYHLIGHELGHIKAGHMLYKTMGYVLMNLLQAVGHWAFGVGDAIGIGLALAYLEWSRQAELTCDRAGLLCTQNFETSAQSELRMTAGHTRFSETELSTEAFLEQARAYQDMNLFDSMGKMLIFMFVELGSTHPMPVHRTKELEKWFLSGEYDKIMNGDYARSTATAGSSK